VPHWGDQNRVMLHYMLNKWLKSTISWYWNEEKHSKNMLILSLICIFPFLKEVAGRVFETSALEWPKFFWDIFFFCKICIQILVRIHSVVLEIFSCLFVTCLTDRQTNRQTNRQTSDYHIRMVETFYLIEITSLLVVDNFRYSDLEYWICI